MKPENVTLDNVWHGFIKIDRKNPSNEKILNFIAKFKNLYVFKVNGDLVRMNFFHTDKTVESLYR